MPNLEQQHKNEPHLIYWLGNATAIDDANVKSIGLAWLFKDKVPLHRGYLSNLSEPAPLALKWIFMPRITGEQSMFFNAVFFLRLSFPFGIFASFRWSSSTTKRAMFQTGFGWKLNGRFGIPFRFQSDTSSAEGVTGPNTGASPAQLSGRGLKHTGVSRYYSVYHASPAQLSGRGLKHINRKSRWPSD